MKCPHNKVSRLAWLQRTIRRSATITPLDTPGRKAQKAYGECGRLNRDFALHCVWRLLSILANDNLRRQSVGWVRRVARCLPVSLIVHQVAEVIYLIAMTDEQALCNPALSAIKAKTMLKPALLFQGTLA